jgi:hypothetical protein
LVSDLQKIATRRNEIIHTIYFHWTTADGEAGLLGQNSKLRGSKGEREQSEVELLPKGLGEELGNLNSTYGRLDSYRLKIIEWVYPRELV